jgi:hypothetical protein
LDIEATIARVKELTAQREAINKELSAIFSGQGTAKRAPPTCKACGEEGHRAGSPQCSKTE